MKATRDDGGPAFPVAADVNPDGNQAGMRLRDWFAGMALQGMMANPECNAMAGEDIARNCYRIAEEMLSVRDAKAQQQQHVIRTKDFTYECGDGCCFEQGVDVFVGEEHICSVPSLEYAIEELFEHFGIDVRVQHG